MWKYACIDLNYEDRKLHHTRNGINMTPNSEKGESGYQFNYWNSLREAIFISTLESAKL